MKILNIVLTLFCILLSYGGNCRAATSTSEITGQYLLSASLNGSGELDNIVCLISQGTAPDQVIVEFSVTIPGISSNVDIRANAHFADEILTFYGNELKLANSAIPGLSISLGHRSASGNTPTEADAISAQLKEEDFIFDPNDCIILKYLPLYSVVVSDMIMTREEEELPTCRFVGSLPANGAVVKSISKITTFWDRIDDRVVVNSKPIIIYNAKDEEVTTGRFTNTSDSTCVITVEPAVTTPGNYRLEIPEGIVSTRKGIPLNSAVSLYLNITDENFIPNIDALTDEYSLSFAIDNGTWSDLPVSIYRKGELKDNELIVKFPIILNGQQYNLEILSIYEDGMLYMNRKESDVVTSPSGDLLIGFYHWNERHLNKEYVEQISARWNGIGFSFDPDDCIWVRYADTQVPILFAYNLILNKVNKTTYKCSEVSFDYDGRYLRLIGNGLWDVIYYSMDPEIIPENGTKYQGSFDIGGINSNIYAVAMKDGYEPSEISHFTPEAYGVEGEAWVKQGNTPQNTLQAAYYWLSREQQYTGWPFLTVHGWLDTDSYAFLVALKALRHLDLSDAISETIPNNALMSTDIISISLPKGIQKIGNNAFTFNPNLSALIWNTESDVNSEIASVLNTSLDGQGVLFYINGYNYSNDTNSLTVIKDGVANNPILLKESNAWYCPKDFKAKSISYVKKFSKKTSIDGCSGWETIALPFDVEDISFGSEPLYPFGNTQGNDLSKRFWLYSADNGWHSETGIQAYTPYLIAMPNNEAYYHPYNIVGSVTFSATDVNVGASPEEKGDALSSDMYFHCNFLNHKFDNTNVDDDPTSEGMMVVNDDYFEGSEPGSIFVMGIRSPSPFEAYASGTGIRRIPIMDSSLATEEITELNIRIWNEGNSIFILSPLRAELPIYDLSGRCVALKTILPNEICRIDGLSSGIYLIANKKLMVK